MKDFFWLLLSYQVPATPSKHRVYVWRKLKEIGATYFRQGVAILPNNPHNLMHFQKLSDRLNNMDGGESSIAEMRFLDHQQNIKIISQFRKQSNKEYQKIIVELGQLTKLSPKNALEANVLKDKVAKLKLKLSQVKSRDYFKMSSEPEVSSGFIALLKDMSSATEDMKHYINAILGQ